VVGEDDLYRAPQHVAAEVVDRHAHGRDSSLPADVGIGPAISRTRPSFNGACAEAGGEKAATNKADSRVVSRIVRLPGFAAAGPAPRRLRTERKLRPRNR
jgi:hypothetical protein